MKGAIGIRVSNNEIEVILKDGELTVWTPFKVGIAISAVNFCEGIGL